MRKTLFVALAATVAVGALTSVAAMAAPAPFQLKTSAGRAYAPDYNVIGNSTVAQASWSKAEAKTGKFSMLLEKTAPTSDYVFAAAILSGVEGKAVAELGTIGFSVKGPCTGGSPRFNLYYDNDGDGAWDGYAFYGCGNHVTGTSGGWTTMSVSASSPDAVVGDPMTLGSTVVQLSVLVDETGTYYVDDVVAAGGTVGEPNGSSE